MAIHSVTDRTVKVGVPPVLFNCLSKPQYVLVGERVVELPKGPCPTLIDTMGERGELAVRVHPGATDVAELEVTSGEVRGILEMPPAMEGALYLVEDEVLLRCPHRSDLVTPTLYRWIVAEGHDVSAVADDPEDWLGESLGRITVLSAVAGKLGVAGEDTPTQMI